MSKIATQITGRVKKVLVVDDNPATLSFVNSLLLGYGYQVSTAVDGLSALEILESNIPDVIIMDLIMPNINGETLCRMIRRMPHLRNVYIIVLSAVAAEHRQNLVALGANACIAKGPFNKMAERIFTTLNKLESCTPGDFTNEIIGLEETYSRNIVKELLAEKKHQHR